MLRRRHTLLLALLAAAGAAGACASDGTGPEKSPSLAALGDSSGGGGGGGGGGTDTVIVLPPPDTGDTIIPPPPPDTGDTIAPPPPPPPPPPVCTANRAVLEGTVVGWAGPGTDSLSAPKVKDVTVQVYRFTGDSVGGNPQFELVATETTNGAGKFQVRDLQIGIYRLVLTPPSNSAYRQTTSVHYIASCDRHERTFFLVRK